MRCDPTDSSEGLDDVEGFVTLSVRGGGEGGWGALESRHCAACEGRVILAFVGALLWPLLCKADRIRFMRLVLVPSCPPPRPDIDMAVDNEVCKSISMMTCETSPATGWLP